MIGSGIDKRKFLRSPLVWSAAAFLFFNGLFLLFLVISVPDISVLGRIAEGEPAVPIKNLLGREFFVYHSPQYGQKQQVPLSEISDEMIALTISTEDSTFFSNPGFSPIAILRAFLQNIRLRTTFSGASTITQQVVKNIFFSEDVRFERSFQRKAMEIFLSAAVTFCYDKETILSIYLNEIYYGRYATGVEQAAAVFFGKHASELDLAEAAFIAGLPQAPNYYGNDPAAGARRQREVLRLFRRTIREKECIQISDGSNPRLFCPSLDEIEAYFRVTGLSLHGTVPINQEYRPRVKQTDHEECSCDKIHRDSPVVPSSRQHQNCPCVCF